MLYNYFFPILWYTMLFGISSSLLFFYIQNGELFSISSFINNNELLQKFWIFPFYLLSELCYFSLNKIGEREDKKLLDYYTPENRKKSRENTAVIVTCHQAEEEIRKNALHLRSLFDYIFIADNDNNESENLELKEFCRANNLIYIHYGIPNKTNAILQTAIYIEKEFPLITKVVLLDDDTILEDNFFIRDDLLSQSTVAGYTCVIGIQKSSSCNMLEELIDFEYRTISYRNRSRNWHSLKFLHGIICVYRLQPLLEIYRWNPCNVGGLPFGEDAFAGITARNIGYSLKQDHLNSVLTFCPKRLFSFQAKRTQGYGASSLFKQRVLRWYLSWPRRVPNEFGLLFFYDCGSSFGNILYRFDFVWYIWILSIASWWIGILVEICLSFDNFMKFSRLHILFYVLNVATAFLRRSIMSKREGKNIRMLIPFLFPLFLLILMFFYSFSFLISVLYYIPFFRVRYKECYQRSFSTQTNRIDF